MHRPMRFVAALALGAAAGAACGDEGDDEGVAEACEVADHCYEDAAREDIVGEITCLERVPGGYCTHLCQTDADCCVAAGECEDGHPQVCAPFESSGMMMCFLSCDDADVVEEDKDAYCHDHSHRDFVCRSTGGGSANRKVCA